AGSWSTALESVNGLVDDLQRPTTEVARVIVAVAEGDLSQKMALNIDGQPLKGEFARIGTTVNTMVDQLGSFADEVTRVAREHGTERDAVPQPAGHGSTALGSVLGLDDDLQPPTTAVARGNIALAAGALAQSEAIQNDGDQLKGEIARIETTVNTMVDQLGS